MRGLIGFLLCFLLSIGSEAYQIPASLNKADRIETLEILGFATTFRAVSNPYPLGGYSGLEVGLTRDLIDLKKFSELGSRPPPQDDLNFDTISIGKGLYNDLDIFVGFVPFSSSLQISNFGAQGKWKFYEARYIPFTLSVLAHASSTNFKNLLVTTGYGTDLVAAIHYDSMALFAGVGHTAVSGVFTGGNDGVTDTGDLQTERVTSIHQLMGITYGISPFFLSLQMDQYSHPIYSGRIGLRF